MSDIDSYLKEVLERARKATPGPWYKINDMISTDKEHYLEKSLISAGGYPYFGELKKSEDADFIAHSRTDVERLAKYCIELREVLKFYADKNTYQTRLSKSGDGGYLPWQPLILDDKGAIAQRVLEKEIE